MPSFDYQKKKTIVQKVEIKCFGLIFDWIFLVLLQRV